MNTVEAGNQPQVPHKVSFITVDVCIDNLKQGTVVSE